MVKNEQEKVVQNHFISLKEETEFNKETIKSGILFQEQNLKKIDSLINLLEQETNADKVNSLAFNLLKGTVQDNNVYFSKRFKNIINTYRYSVNNRLKKYKDCSDI